MGRRFGLIGRDLSHSASATYFKQKFSSEALYDCRYDIYELPTIDEFPSLLTALPDLRGVNVTIPFKREILRYINNLSPDAQCIGAVNCIRREKNGGLTGFNTDVDGLRASFDELLGAKSPKKALIIGSGGASKAVQFVLSERNIEFDVVSRLDTKGSLTYDQLSLEVIGNTYLIINASPVGMYPNVDQAPLIPYEGIGSSHKLFDLVYNPTMTKFLEHGVRRGATVMNGELMFRTQAEASWKIWNE